MLVLRAARQRRIRRQARGVSAPRVLRWGIAITAALAGMLVVTILAGLAAAYAAGGAPAGGWGGACLPPPRGQKWGP